MGLLLAEGKMLKHLKEKPHHIIPYHNLSFFVVAGNRRYGCTPTLRLLVQPCDGDDYVDYYYFCPFPSNGAPVE
jgi:hypothetical protein